MGRVDDVISVAGHRLGTMEIESALVSHPAVAEAAVVGKPDELKGEEVVAFVTLEGDRTPSDELEKELKQHVVNEIGAIARPGEIRFTDALPKTRSGKIIIVPTPGMCRSRCDQRVFPVAASRASRLTASDPRCAAVCA